MENGGDEKKNVTVGRMAGIDTRKARACRDRGINIDSCRDELEVI